jgi:hypothetical protein
MITPLDYQDWRKDRRRGPRPVDWFFIACILASLAWYARLLVTHAGTRPASHDFLGPAFWSAVPACLWALLRLRWVPADTRILCFPMTLAGVTASLYYGMTFLRNCMHW